MSDRPKDPTISVLSNIPANSSHIIWREIILSSRTPTLNQISEDIDKSTTTVNSAQVDHRRLEEVHDNKK